jgi:hypothetical protein
LRSNKQFFEEKVCSHPPAEGGAFGDEGCPKKSEPPKPNQPDSQKAASVTGPPARPLFEMRRYHISAFHPAHAKTGIAISINSNLFINESEIPNDPQDNPAN